MPRILHFGVGNFHRAHQAAYTAQTTGDWRITGVIMGNGALFDVMANGQGYTLGVRGPKGTIMQQVMVHDRMILAKREPQDVVAAFVDPDLHVVTLTVTEKGYCLDAATGALDLRNPIIAADLASRPRSAMGLLAHGLAERTKAGLPALTVISCDNLSSNGKKLRRAVNDFAERAALSLDPRTSFPDSMVDRITPATADVSAPIITEEFTEWVVEDKFSGLRPEWETVGAVFTSDVSPFEMRKLRLLNAAHSWLAYAGQLAGYTYVHEAMSDPNLRTAVERLWDEAQATLPDEVQLSTPAYRAALIDRFAVAEMRHALAQISADGSLKLRERIVPLITEDKQAPQASEVVASWIAYVLRKHDANETLIDPNAARIAKIIESETDLSITCTALAHVIGVSRPTEDWLTMLTKQVVEYVIEGRA